MIKNKGGLSAIVTTLLVILLVLVAVGIVWAVVSNLLKGGAGSAELAVKCLNIDVEATAVNCDTAIPALCNMTFERTGTNNDEIAGVWLVFRNSTAGTTSGSVVDVTGNIERLVGKTVLLIDSNITTGSDSVDVTVFFEDASGNEDPCPGDPNTFIF